jgi:GAF domain-containing protein
MKTMNNIKQTGSLTKSIPAAAIAYDSWRERFLRTIMIGALVFGLIALILNILQAQNKIFITLLIIAYAILAVITFANLPYKFRAVTVLVIFYAIGIVALMQDGAWGGARLLFLTFIGMSLLLFNSRAGIAATIISILTYAVGGILFINEVVTPINSEISIAGSPITWMGDGSVLLLVAAVFIMGLHIFQQGFAEAQEKTQVTLETLQKERADLEERIQERTHSLTRKSELLRVSSYVSRQVSTNQDFSLLLNSTVELITEKFGYYHAGIFLLNDRGDRATLQSASSDGGRQLLENNYGISLTKKTDPVAVAINRNKAQLALDFGENAAVFDNPLLPATRSQIVVPIVLGNKPSGALDIQSTESRAFTNDDIDVFQSLVDHIAIAIENARLLNETQTVLMQLEAASIAQTNIAWNERSKSKSQAYTYTSMGIRPEKPAEEDANSLDVPITLRGHTIGAITLSRRKGEGWDENDQSLAAKIASQASLAIDNLRLLEDAQKSAARDQTLANVSTRIRETLDMEAILQSAAREFQRALNLKEAEVRLGMPDTLMNQGSPTRKIVTGILRSRTQKFGRKKM